MATIRDVAKRCGVSVATVSYVINDGPRAVRPETRKRVLDAIAELEYHPNAMARGLARRRMNTIGIMLPTVESTITTNTYASGILQGVLSASADAGLNVTIITTRWVNAEVSSSAFRDRRTDGLLLVAPPVDSDLLPALAAIDLPLVAISTSVAGLGITSVDVDNLVGSKMAMSHLLELGHKRIAHVLGTDNAASMPARRDGYLEAMQEAGLAVQAKWLVPGNYDGIVDSSFIDLLRSPDRPTAVFAANDYIAIIVIRMARELGLSVPGDLSVVGFDDIPSVSLMTPALTTVRQPLADIGQLATQLLMKRIDDDTHEASAHTIAPSLVVRDTTRAV